MNQLSEESRRWCFTLHNYTEEDINRLLQHNTTYIIFGKEICPTTGTPHLQGYMEFKSETSRRTQIKKLHPKIWLKKSRGDAEDNEKYCSKDGDYYEQGEPKMQGKRSDIDRVTKELMETSLTVDEIAIDSPMFYHQYGRTLNKLEELKMRKLFRNEMTQGIWYFGETGTGKSHTALKDYNPDTHYIYPNDNGWWDGYKQQETVIFNEFRGQIPYSELLTIVDKWPHQVKRRGREPLPFTSKTVIITSSLTPEEVYKNLSQNDDLAQLYRRFKIINLKKKYIETPNISI